MADIRIKGFAGLKNALKAVDTQHCLDLINKGRHLAALEYLKDIKNISSYPPDQRIIFSEAYYEIAKLFHNEGDFDKAEDCLVNSINLNKKNTIASLRLESIRKSHKIAAEKFSEFRRIAENLSKSVFASATTKLFRSAIKITCYKDCNHPQGESPLHCSECKGFVKKPKTGLSEHGSIDKYFALGIYRWKGDEHASEEYSRMVRRFKNGDQEVVETLPQLFSDAISRRTDYFRDIDLITAVPGDPVRQKERGYNPPSVLAEILAKDHGIPFFEGVLEKRGSQRAKDLTSAEVAGLYRAGRGKTQLLQGKIVLLVDDVATRGATLSACARLLKGLGANKIYCAVLAKAETTVRSENKTMHDLEKLAKWYQLSQSKYLGPVRFRALVESYGSDVHRVFSLSDEEILSIKGITKQALDGIRSQANKYNEALEFMKTQMDLMKKCGGGIVTLDSPDYPEFLRKSSMCHALLYYRGELSKFKSYTKAIAIVGSREATEESKKIATDTAKDLARRGWVISSGLANGIDAAAHKGALLANGLTIAVLGCGPDILYPPGSGSLNAEIADKGLIISEFPFGAKIDDWKLKKRNKTIVGAALGAFVVQTSKTGGAMNAVKGCQEQKKPIFTIEPPPRDEKFSGNAEILDALKGIKVRAETAAKTIADKLDKGDGLFSV